MTRRSLARLARPLLARRQRLLLLGVRGPLLRMGIAPVWQRGGIAPVKVYRSRLPDGLSWAGAPGRLVIGLDKITTAAGFSFAPDGWHPHVETLRWWQAGDGNDPDDSPLAHLYRVFQPETVGQALLLFEDLSEPVAGLTDVPLVRGQLRELWNPYRPRSASSNGTKQPLDRPGLYWGPATTADVISEIERTLAVYESLARDGFRDDGPGKHAVSGYLLVRGDDYRFVVHQGHHRLAALAVLGYSTVPVYLSLKVPPVVRAERLGRWTNGRHPRYTPAAAALLFTRLFESTGLDKARRLGLTRGMAGIDRVGGSDGAARLDGVEGSDVVRRRSQAGRRGGF